MVGLLSDYCGDDTLLVLHAFQDLGSNANTTITPDYTYCKECSSGA